MKFLSALPLLLLPRTNAFSVTTVTSHSHTRASPTTASFVARQEQKLTFLSSAAPSDVEASSEEDGQDEKDDATSMDNPTMMPNRPTLSARDELVRASLDLTDASPTGLFLTVPSQASDFIRAVARLEAVAPSTNDESEALSIGDWTLVATCKRTKFPSPQRTSDSSKKEKDKKGQDDSSSKGGLDFLASLPKPSLPTKSKFTKDLQKSITVTQRIRSMTDASQSTNTIDRIDHVIAFDNQVSETSTLLPPILNPLKINQSKFTLVHNAKVQSFVPFLTSLQLQSVIINVAGEEGNALQLDPKGADVLGINIPQLNDWMNGGQFETTYVDGNVRVSRGTSGVLEETRVFVKEGFNLDSLLVKEEKENLDVDTEEEEEKVKMDEPTNQLKKVATAVGSVVDALDKTREDVRSTIQSDLEVTAQDVQKVLEEDLKTVEEAITSVKSAVIANDELEEAVDSVVGAVGDLSKDVKDVVDGAVDDLKTKVDDDTKKIQSAVEGVKSVVEGKSKESKEEEVVAVEEEDEETTTEEGEEEKDDDVTTEKTKPEEKSDEK